MTPARFDELYRSAAAYIRAYAASLCRGSLVEFDDVVQESLLSAWERRETFTGNTVEDFRRWLTGFVHNKYRCTANLHRLAKPHADITELTDVTTAAVQEIKVELAETLAVLNRLTLPHRRAIEMSADGCSHEEMARRMNVSVGTAASRISRARSALREALA